MSTEGPAGRPGPRWGGDAAHEPAAPADPVANAFEEARRHVLPDPPVPELPLASVIRRAGGLLVDLLIKLILLEVIFAAGGMDAGPQPVLQTVIPAQLLSHGYDWLFWMHGWTPGSRLLGMRIVRLDGGAPGARGGLVRAVVAFFSDFFFGLGYLWAIWDPRRQTWHDKVAGTFVVNSRVDPPLSAPDSN